MVAFKKMYFDKSMLKSLKKTNKTHILYISLINQKEIEAPGSKRA